MPLNILIGCDPEVFVQDKKTKQFVSAHNMVKGDKHKPQPVKLGAVQVDGMALEFNTNPAKDANEFLVNVKGVYKELREMIPNKYNLVATPSITFDPEYFDKEAAPESKILGCDPDYNAYTGERNTVPTLDGRLRTLRTGSGHIHIGWCNGVDPMDPSHFADCRDVVKQLDCALGLRQVYYDIDTDRRALYGKAGAFRPKSYGVEYRVLSNAWLNTDGLINWVYRTATAAVRALEQGVFFEDYAGGRNIEQCVNEGIKIAAGEQLTYMMSDYGCRVPTSAVIQTYKQQLAAEAA